MSRSTPGAPRKVRADQLAGLLIRQGCRQTRRSTHLASAFRLIEPDPPARLVNLENRMSTVSLENRLSNVDTTVDLSAKMDAGSSSPSEGSGEPSDRSVGWFWVKGSPAKWHQAIPSKAQFDGASASRSAERRQIRSWTGSVRTLRRLMACRNRRQGSGAGQPGRSAEVSMSVHEPRSAHSTWVTRFEWVRSHPRAPSSPVTVAATSAQTSRVSPTGVRAVPS